MNNHINSFFDIQEAVKDFYDRPDNKCIAKVLNTLLKLNIILDYENIEEHLADRFYKEYWSKDGS